MGRGGGWGEGGGRERATGGSMQQSSAREVGREAANEWARDAYRDQRTKICLHFHTETNDASASALISSVVLNGFISFCLIRHVFDQKYVKGRKKKTLCLIKRTISIQCARAVVHRATPTRGIRAAGKLDPQTAVSQKANSG